MNKDFGFWFSGLCDGEACFGLRSANGKHTYPVPRFDLTLRDDDTPMLDMIQGTLGFGKVYARKTTGYVNPQGYKSKGLSTYVVWNKADCKVLADFLRQFPLRSKKKRDFELWAEAADLWASVELKGWKSRTGTINAEKHKVVLRLRELATEIVKVRKYVSPN